MKKVIKYRVRILGWFLASILQLLVLVGLLIQTSFFKEKLANVVANQSTRFLNGQLKIGEIEGNFFTNFEMKDVLLSDETDTVAFISQFRAEYDLLSIFEDQFKVHLIEITQPKVILSQNNDSIWNFQQLIKASANEEDTSSNSSFGLSLSTFNLRNGKVSIQSLDTIIPSQIDDLNLLLSVEYAVTNQQLDLNNLSFSTTNPNLTLKKLSFNLSRNQTGIELKDFHVKTAQNQLTANAEYLPDPNAQASGNLESSPLHLKEFEFFMAGFKIPATPILKVDAELKGDSVFATLKLSDQGQQIHLEASSSNLISFLSASDDSILNYHLKGIFTEINLAQWVGDSELDYLINGELNLDGSGTDMKNAKVSLKGDFRDCIIQKRPVEKLLLSLNLEHGVLDGVTEGNGDFGKFKLSPKIQNLQTEPIYQVDLIAAKFNIANLLGNDSLQSDLNFQMSVQGTSFDPKKIDAKAKVRFSKSSFQKINLDTLLAKVSYRQEEITIDSLWAKSLSTELLASGIYNLKSNSSIALKIKFDDLDEFASYFPFTDFKSSGEVNASLNGTMDHLFLQSEIALDQTSFQDFIVEKVVLNANGELSKNNTLFDAKIVGKDVSYSSFSFDSLTTTLRYTTDSISFKSSLAGNELSSDLEGGVALGNPLQIELSDWRIDYKQQLWSLQQKPTRIQFDSLDYSVDHFKMASGDSDSAQYVSVDGKIRRKGAENLRLKIANVDVAALMKLLDQDVDVDGKINADLKLAGDAEFPLLDGNIFVDQARFSGYQFSEFGGTVAYKNDLMKLQFKVVPIDSGRIVLNGSIPMSLQLDSLSYSLDTSDSIDVKLNVDRFPLAILKGIDITKDIGGYLEGQLNIDGTMDAPNPNGNLALHDASIRISEYGISYDDISFYMEFLKNQVQLDTFFVKSEDGNFTANGTIDFDSNFYNGEISQSTFSLNFDDFNPVNHRQFNMQLSGDASLSVTKGDVVFDGDLTIPQSEIYLPAIMNLAGKVSVPELPKPILVQQLEKQQLLNDTAQLKVAGNSEKDSINFDYLDVITGRVKLNIPKNSWIKNDDLHLEISGDLEMIKNKEFFELFGTVEVVRGQYDLLGRTFIIDEGTISFQGGEELIPEMNITASYTFRNLQRAEQRLSVTVTGTSENPSVGFTLDGSSIREGDALSYIMFGKSMNELTINEQENVSGAGGLAGTAAASFLSSQISSFLSKKLNVNYVKVKSNGGFANATVVVGKYITNDLFLSYEQRFGETNEKNISKYEVRLEYELFKFLFFQLNNSSNDSGFDVIFKLNSN
ncbi:translocation/assembly module TamB domain-containing protein [Sunxiuqinia sp. A32]|uniref:translocation/assembly module TamB domain-containing protein n=1 Tax=Sunxiuqinia sp. A32 TaxID=3461496 RepID=UPI0040459860